MPENKKQALVNVVWRTGKDATPPLEPEWIEALAYSDLVGIAAWVTNRRAQIVDATQYIADVLGRPLSEIIGIDLQALETDFQSTTPRSVRKARLARIWETGAPDTDIRTTYYGAGGWKKVIVTSRGIEGPDGRQWLLHVAHDITSADELMDALQTPVFQGQVMILAEKDGTCLAATDAAAQLCGLSKGADLHGVSIFGTAYESIAARELAEVQRSRAMEQPAFAVEWLEVPGCKDISHPECRIEWLEIDSGAILPFALSRMGFPGGRWMVVMIPITLDTPFFQYPPEQVIKAPNFQAPGRVTVKQLHAVNTSL